MYSHLTHLECTNCGATFSTDHLITTCPECGKVLYARYDLAAAAKAMTKESLLTRPWNLWRYHEIMPVQDPANALTLGEGGTAILDAPRLGAAFGYDRLKVKDEGRNPTGSFKSRGLAAAVSRAKELGASAVSIPSAGNAAAAMSAYAANGGSGRLRLHAAGCAVGHEGRVHRVWRESLPGQWPDQRCGQNRQDRLRRTRLVRRLDVERAVSGRRQEDDGS